MQRPRAEIDLELSSLITEHLRNIRHSVAEMARRSNETSIQQQHMLLAIQLLEKSAAQLKARALNDA